MKTTFIRALAIAMLATSMSAFAATNDGKTADASAPCTNSKQDDAAPSVNTSKKDKKSQRNHKDQQQDQNGDQFQGIWG